MTRHRLALPLLLSIAMAVNAGLLPAPARAQEDAAAEEPAQAPAARPRPAPPKPAARPAPAKPAPRPAAPVAQAPQQQAPSVTQPAASTASLPNGASAISENYGDWTLDCRINEGQKFCGLSQSQGNSQTNQRVFAIELRTPRNGQATGTILMPFGLKLDNGAVLKLDDKNLGQGLRFSTCMPAGCLLPISFPTVATDAMKGAKTLVVAALNLSNGEPVSFNVSLNGFAAALDRIGQLDN